MSAIDQIMETMKGPASGKWVNPWVAMKSCDDLSEGSNALEQLVLDNILERRYIRGLPLYRYIPPMAPKLKEVKK